MVVPIDNDVALSSITAILRRQLTTALKLVVRAVDAVVVWIFRFFVAIALIVSVFLRLAAVLRLPLCIRSILRCAVWIGTLLSVLSTH